MVRPAGIEPAHPAPEAILQFFLFYVKDISFTINPYFIRIYRLFITLQKLAMKVYILRYFI